MAPMEDPIYIAAIHTNTSYLAAMNTGISIGYSAMVSSARPKVVPPKDIKIVTTIMRIYSLPLVALDKALIPAPKAPEWSNMLINPPNTRTNKIMSIHSYTPLTEPERKAFTPCGFFSNF